MTIEEKAKAYDEVLERVKPLYEWAKKDDSPMWSTYEYLFPQLAESEDERIRKWLIKEMQKFHEEAKKEECWEDFKMTDAALFYLEKQKESHFTKRNALFDKCIVKSPYSNFLKSLRPQSKLEWNKDDEHRRQQSINVLERSGFHILADWLKSLPERFNLPPKQEWSEEDERNRDRAIFYTRFYQRNEGTTKGSEECIDWLKSLRPQYHGDVTMTEAYKMGLEAGKASSWKPSKEQMDRLFSIVAALRKDYCDDMADFLANLYANLKNLM